MSGGCPAAMRPAAPAARCGPGLAFDRGTGDARSTVRGSKLAVVAALAAALSAGCDHVPQNAVESCQAEVHVLPAQTDILLVIDDSGSMAEEQENLRQNLGVFVSALADSGFPARRVATGSSPPPPTRSRSSPTTPSASVTVAPFALASGLPPS